jgi:peptide/nickel transport system substrate-binding protein
MHYPIFRTPLQTQQAHPSAGRGAVHRVSRRTALMGTVAGLATACGGKSSPPVQSGSTASVGSGGTPRTGGVFQATPLAASPPHLDPQQTSSFYTQTPMTYVMERLMNYKTAPMDASVGAASVPVPGLAVSAESPDAIIWTVKLRTDVRFQNVAPVNGQPFDSEDVKASWTRALSLPNNPFSGAIDMLDAGQITTPGADTVVFKLKYPYAPFPAILAANTIGHVYPRQALAGSYDPMKQAIGTGPFILETFTPDVELVMKRNPDYYVKGLPYVDGTRTAIIADQAQRLTQFVGGHLDDFGAVPPTDVDAAKKGAPGAKWLTTPPQAANTLWLQLGDPSSAFQDIRVRRALSMAIDRDAIGKSVLQGDYVLSFNPGPYLGPKQALTVEQVPSSVAQYYKFNPGDAKKLLDAAGVAGMSLTIDFPAPYPQVPGNQQVAEAVNNMFNQVGIKSTLRQIDYTKEYLNSGKGEAYGFFPKDHVVVSGLRAGSTGDPDGRIFDYYHSRSQVGAEHLKDPTLDGMIDRERAIVNQDERYKACIDIQQYIADKMYMVGFMPGPNVHEAVQPWIKNLYPTGAGSSVGGFGSETIARLWIER